MKLIQIEGACELFYSGVPEVKWPDKKLINPTSVLFTTAAIANYVVLLVVGFLTGTNTMVPIYDCIPHRRTPFFGASKKSQLLFEESEF